MAHLHFPHLHFPHISKSSVFYALAIIPGGLIIYTLYMIFKGIVNGNLSF